jgi:hypothetical protein
VHPNPSALHDRIAPADFRQIDQATVFCEFPEFARRSRQWLLAYVAETGAMYFSSHFPATSAGRIMQHNGQYKWHFS